MAYIYKSLGDKDCEADAYSDVPIAGLDTVGANVSLRFRMGIRWGFWLSLMNIARSVIAQIALKIKSWFLLYFSYVLFAVNFTTLVIWFVFINLWRWNHSGRVCSGDYLTPEQRTEPNVTQYYIITEGLFLKWILIILYSIVGLGCYSICFVALFLSQKKTKD